MLRNSWQNMKWIELYSSFPSPPPSTLSTHPIHPHLPWFLFALSLDWGSALDFSETSSIAQMIHTIDRQELEKEERERELYNLMMDPSRIPRLQSGTRAIPVSCSMSQVFGLFASETQGDSSPALMNSVCNCPSSPFLIVFRRNVVASLSCCAPTLSISGKISSIRWDDSRVDLGACWQKNKEISYVAVLSHFFHFFLFFFDFSLICAVSWISWKSGCTSTVAALRRMQRSNRAFFSSFRWSERSILVWGPTCIRVIRTWLTLT